MVMLTLFPAGYSPRTRTLLMAASVLLNVLGVFALQESLTGTARSRFDGTASTIVQPVLRHDAAPVRLRIAAVGIDAPVVPVGVRDDGLMDIPPSAHTVGWFAPGYRPGEAGNAVLAGHLDRESGRPAVFWDLRRLRPGDIVELERADGSVLRYRVTHRKTYAIRDVPMNDIFGSHMGSRLNLVTCNGAWQEQLATYNRRLVVYTEHVR